MAATHPMKGKRKDDRPGKHIWFRSERMTNNNGHWYFVTREGTLEGPYADELQAHTALDTYIRFAQLNTAPADAGLEMKGLPEIPAGLRRSQLKA